MAFVNEWGGGTTEQSVTWPMDIGVSGVIGTGHTLILAMTTLYPLVDTSPTFDITDSAGNTWTLLSTEKAGATATTLSLFYAPITKALTNLDTITVNSPNYATRFTWSISRWDEYLAPVGEPVTDDNGGAGSTTITTGLTTAPVGWLMGGVGMVSPGRTVTGSDGTIALTKRQSTWGSGDRGVYQTYRQIVAAGAYSLDSTLNSSSLYRATGVPFALGAPPPDPDPDPDPDPPDDPGSGAFVREFGDGLDLSSVTDFSIPIPASVPAGHTLMVGLVGRSSVDLNPVVTDSKGNIWEIVNIGRVNEGGSTQGITAMCRVSAPLTASDTIDVSYSSSSDRTAWTVGQWSTWLRVMQPVEWQDLPNGRPIDSTPREVPDESYLIGVVAMETPRRDPASTDIRTKVGELRVSNVGTGDRSTWLAHRYIPEAETAQINAEILTNGIRGFATVLLVPYVPPQPGTYLVVDGEEVPVVTTYMQGGAELPATLTIA